MSSLIVSDGFSLVYNKRGGHLIVGLPYDRKEDISDAEAMVILEIVKQIFTKDREVPDYRAG